MPAASGRQIRTEASPSHTTGRLPPLVGPLMRNRTPRDGAAESPSVPPRQRTPAASNPLLRGDGYTQGGLARDGRCVPGRRAPRYGRGVVRLPCGGGRGGGGAACKSALQAAGRSLITSHPSPPPPPPRDPRDATGGAEAASSRKRRRCAATDRCVWPRRCASSCARACGGGISPSAAGYGRSRGGRVGVERSG